MAAEVPTFKLVLVGDGGTGKVSKVILKTSSVVIIFLYSEASKSPLALLAGSLVLNIADPRNYRPRSSSAI